MDTELALKIIEGLEQCTSEDVTTIADALRVLAEHSFESRKGVSTRGVAGAPDWLGYEMALWKLSERIRLWLKPKRKLKGTKNPLFDVMESIVLDSRFGKGRQDFVLVMGEYASPSYGPSLAKLVTDVDVMGHAIKAVTKLGVSGLSAQVNEVSNTSKTGWVRAAARKYLEKFS
ncbi:hypothetical protein [Paucibacter sp. XJ19-41]|uniref:hypothetical protein n=1 Tax=Paucibacter sp. XJ19-41 TaxID=2927824 RepID=UPI002349EF5E|nr:hypothetical protein [Paucibacter sp. XJ19-41]MDC6167879.1 hypothetical protein [Paucibacter sp. XJ19-41]